MLVDTKLKKLCMSAIMFFSLHRDFDLKVRNILALHFLELFISNFKLLQTNDLFLSPVDSEEFY